MLRVHLLTCLLIAGAAAGCFGGKDKDADDVVPLPRDLVHDLTYDGFGNLVATPDELAGAIGIGLHPVGGRGGEPNVGVTSDGHIFAVAGQNTMRSRDHGKTWDIAFNMTAFWGPLADPPIPNDTPVVGDPVRGLTRSSDPMLWVDPDTDRIFTDHMTGLYCSKLFYSDDDGATWIPSPFACGIPVNDHQKVMTARWGPDTVPAPNPVYPNLVYYCYNKLLATNCAVSYNGGLSFQYDRPVTIAAGDGEQPVTLMAPCGGINGHPAAAPDGTVYVPMNLGCPGPVVAVTTTNGLTWTVQVGPEDYGAEEIDPDITVTPDGTAYMLYRGEKDHLQYLVRSTDRFATFEGPWRVSPPGVQSTVFAGITSGDDGRVAMSFLGTRDSDEYPEDVANETRWHLWTVFSYDAADEDPTFRAIQVTPDADPVQIGCVWLSGGGNPCRNMLDFIDMTSDLEGRTITVISDGCTKDCANNMTATNEQSHSRDVTVAILETGAGLRGARLVGGEVAKD